MKEKGRVAALTMNLSRDNKMKSSPISSLKGSQISSEKTSGKASGKSSQREFKIPPEILEAAKRIAELQEQAKALGLFTNDRELLECPACGLKEDVAFSGLLITYFGEPSGNDTGLRFKETEKDKIYICPNCGKEVEEPEPEDIDFE